MVSGRRAFAFVWITVLLDMVGVGLVMPVLPSLLRELTGRDAAGASVYGGWLFFAYAAMQLAFAPVLGALSDAIGRRPVLLLSVIGLAIDHALTALSPSITWLFVGRLLAGLFGASYATANAYITDVVPPEERGPAFGKLGAAFGIGFILGPAIGGLLGGFGSRVPFFVAAALSLGNFVYGLLVLPETHPPEKRTAFRLVEANPLGALVSMPGGRTVRVLAFSLFAFFLSNTIYGAIWSFYTTERYAWSPRTIGLSLATYGVVGTIVQATMVGPAIARWGERRAAFWSILAGALALLGTGLATQGWMVFVLIIATAPAGIAMPAVNALMSRYAPPEAQGRLQGAISSLEGLSNIGGPLLMAQLFQAYGRTLPGVPFYVATALCVVSLGALVVKVDGADDTTPGEADTSTPPPTAEA